MARTERITVKAINVNISFRVRRHSSPRISLIVDQRHNNPRPTQLLLNIDEIVLIGLLIVRETSVLVLRLHQNHRPTIGNLRLGNNASHLRHVVLSGIDVSLIAGPQSSRNTLEPAGETSTRDFSVNVRAWACNEVDSSFGSGVEEFLEPEDAFGCEIAGFAFEEGPVGVEGDRVVAESFDLLEDV
jgi:hypothetical protein